MTTYKAGRQNGWKAGGEGRKGGSEGGKAERGGAVNATWGIYVKALETGEKIAVDAIGLVARDVADYFSYRH